MIGLKYAGIYRIVNLLDGRSYIGQSKDIEKRFKEHLYHKKSPIDRDIHEYGIDNFKLEILNICDSDDDILDHLEKIYINIYNSSDPEYGYNIHPGGQHDQVGYKNPNTKLTEFDIYNIREDYNNHIPKKTSYIKYKDKISIYGFDEIWQGKS